MFTIPTLQLSDQPPNKRVLFVSLFILQTMKSYIIWTLKSMSNKDNVLEYLSLGMIFLCLFFSLKS
jgi:hypothetical protein